MSPAESETGQPPRTDLLRLYSHPRVVTMLFLGFASGLPFLLVSSTLSFWLTDAGIAVATIGFFAGVRNVYSLKFLWAPFVNQAPLPLLTRHLGQRRGWMLLGQVVVCVSLLAMSAVPVAERIAWVAVAAVIAALGSATQDIALDAYRIESGRQELQPAMLATYTLGYRLAILVTSWGALHLTDALQWPGVYKMMAGLGLIGVVTTLLIKEPKDVAPPTGIPAGTPEVPPQRTLAAWLKEAVVEPFHEFFTRQPARQVLWLLLFIFTYRLSDFSIGNMASTLYKHLGFTNAEIGNIVKFVGLFAVIVGAGFAGWVTQRWPTGRALLVGAVLMAMTNAGFSFLALQGHDLLDLGLVVSAENFAQGFGGVVFVSFLSALVDRRYTATQYALFSSLASLIGHSLSSFGGMAVAAYGYVFFFVATGLLGLPAIVMSAQLMLRQRQPAPRAAP